MTKIHYQSLHIGKVFWKLVGQENEIKPYPISGIEFFEKRDGRTEELILSECTILLKFRTGLYREFLDIDSDGYLKMDETDMFTDNQTAKEESIVIRTKENHESHLVLRNISEEEESESKE